MQSYSKEEIDEITTPLPRQSNRPLIAIVVIIAIILQISLVIFNPFKSNSNDTPPTKINNPTTTEDPEIPVNDVRARLSAGDLDTIRSDLIAGEMLAKWPTPVISRSFKVAKTPAGVTVIATLKMKHSGPDDYAVVYTAAHIVGNCAKKGAPISYGEAQLQFPSRVVSIPFPIDEAMQISSEVRQMGTITRKALAEFMQKCDTSKYVEITPKPAARVPPVQYDARSVQAGLIKLMAALKARESEGVWTYANENTTQRFRIGPTQSKYSHMRVFSWELQLQVKRISQTQYKTMKKLWRDLMTAYIGEEEIIAGEAALDAAYASRHYRKRGQVSGGHSDWLRGNKFQVRCTFTNANSRHPDSAVFCIEVHPDHQLKY